MGPHYDTNLMRYNSPAYEATLLTGRRPVHEPRNIHGGLIFAAVMMVLAVAAVSVDMVKQNRGTDQMMELAQHSKE